MVAVFFPPLAIIPGIRYLRQSDNSSKAVGAIALLVAGISLLVSIYYFVVFWDYAKALFGNQLSGVDVGIGGMDSLMGL